MNNNLNSNLQDQQPKSLESIGPKVTNLRLYTSELEELKRRTSGLSYLDVRFSTLNLNQNPEQLRSKPMTKFEYLTPEGNVESLILIMMPLGQTSGQFRLHRAILDRILIDETKDQWFSFTINTEENWIIIKVNETQVFHGPKLIV